MIGQLTLAASAALDTAATWLDADESKRKLYYGKEEGTKRLRNDDGSANIAKLWLYGVGVPGGIGVVLFIVVFFGISPEQYQGAPYLAASLPFLVQGVWRFLIWKGNVKESKENRVKQIMWRGKIRAALEQGDILRFQDLLNVQTEVAGVWYPQWTPWLTVQAASAAEAFPKLQTVMETWLVIPDEDARRVWIDTKYHPKKTD